MSNYNERLESAKARLNKINEKLEAEKAKQREAKKAIKSWQAKIDRLENAKKQKERTRRLIKIGAEVEAIIGGEIDMDKFREYLYQYQGALIKLKKEESQ